MPAMTQLLVAAPDSRPGARDRVPIPAVPGAASPRPAAREIASSAGLRNAKVLVVDDERDIREGIRDLLETTYNSSVRTAASGAEAMQVLATEPIELVITDFKMEGMNGLQLVDSMMARWPNLRYILITAFDRDLMKSLAPRGRGERFLTKPLDPHNVLSEVEKTLARAKPKGAGEHS